MTHRQVPQATSVLDLAGWLRAHVQPGDDVHLAEGHRYFVDSCSIVHLDDITLHGHGATIDVRTLPSGTDHRRPFELIGCDRWTITDLTIEGHHPPGGGYHAPYAGQHGLTIRGCDRLTACRVTTLDTWGDGVYVGDWGRPTTNLVLCEPEVHNPGRHGITTIAAAGVLVVSPTIAEATRTGFNFEAHPGQQVTDWAAADVTQIHKGVHGLRTITATGEGDVADITFDGFRCAPSRYFDPQVYGEGAGAILGTSRDYGRRARWTIRNVTGGKVDPTGRPRARFLYVEDLDIDLPQPAVTTGSTFTNASSPRPP